LRWTLFWVFRAPNLRIPRPKPSLLERNNPRPVDDTDTQRGRKEYSLKERASSETSARTVGTFLARHLHIQVLLCAHTDSQYGALAYRSSIKANT
jgi:hypothetical protein